MQQRPTQVLVLVVVVVVVVVAGGRRRCPCHYRFRSSSRMRASPSRRRLRPRPRLPLAASAMAGATTAGVGVEATAVAAAVAAAHVRRPTGEATPFAENPAKCVVVYACVGGVVCFYVVRSIFTGYVFFVFAEGVRQFDMDERKAEPFVVNHRCK